MSTFPSTIEPTFADPEREATYRQRGYLTVGTVLDPTQVDELRALAEVTAPVDEHGMVNDYRRDDRTRIQRLTAAIQPMIADRLAELFADHRIVLASFIVKYPDAESAMVLHEDRTHVDEDRFRAGNLWIPLDPVGEGCPNGGVELVPNSHLLTDGLVGTRTPDPWRPYEAFLRRHLVMPNLDPGTGVYYDNRSLHASPPNRSSSPRLAIACLVVPRAAGLRHVVATGRRHRFVFEVDDPFFLDFPPHAIDLAMMQAYPMVAEVDEEVVLDAERVSSVIGGDAAGPHDEPPVPPPAPDGVTRGPRRLPRCEADPPTPPAAPDEAVTRWTAGPLHVTRYQGQAACAAVAGPGRQPSDAPSWAAPFVPPTDDDVTVVSLGEDALVEIEVIEVVDDHRPWTVDVIDVPAGAGHLRVETGDEILDNAASLTITSAKATVWNHGPGNAALLLRVPMRPDRPVSPHGSSSGEDQPAATSARATAGSLTRWARRRWSARRSS